MRQAYIDRILLARKRSPFKPLKISEVDSHKWLSLPAKVFVKRLIDSGVNVVLMNKSKHLNRPEVFGRFQVNQQIKSMKDVEYYTKEWGVGEPQHILNTTHYMDVRVDNLQKKEKIKEKYDQFEKQYIRKFMQLLKSDKYYKYAKACLKNSQGDLDYERLIYLIKHMNLNGEFHHPVFTIDYSGQSFDFIWIPAFRSVLKRSCTVSI